MTHELASSFIRATPKHQVTVAVDLGQVSDPTAVAVLERRVEPTGVFTAPDPRRQSHQVEGATVTTVLRGLKRLPLGLTYPQQVLAVNEIVRRLPCPPEKVTLLIDATGVGRAVFDLFHLAVSPKPLGVVITAGEGEAKNVGGGYWRVPKIVLISSLEAQLHSGALTLAGGLNELKALVGELKDFRRHVTAAGHATFAGRTGAHDDLVLALSIATWWATGQNRNFERLHVRT